MENLEELVISYIINGQKEPLRNWIRIEKGIDRMVKWREQRKIELPTHKLAEIGLRALELGYLIKE